MIPVRKAVRWLPDRRDGSELGRINVVMDHMHRFFTRVAVRQRRDGVVVQAVAVAPLHPFDAYFVTLAGDLAPDRTGRDCLVHHRQR